MVKYYFSGRDFCIEDFQRAKTFASFLPAVAGKRGRPLWAFYANVGQGMGGFGVNGKDTPITPFESADAAYRDIPLHSFRTFITSDGKTATPFFFPHPSQKMTVKKSSFSIEEHADGTAYKITYSTVPERSFAGLIRRVTLTNEANVKRHFSVVDGLPIFFPHGLSNICYKELVSLMAAYCEVEGLDSGAPLVKFKTSTGDNAVVKKAESGNGFVGIGSDGRIQKAIVDPYAVFGDDKTLREPQGLISGVSEQQTENKLPCAFISFERDLAPGESYEFCEIYGTFDSSAHFRECIEGLTLEAVDAMIEESERLITDLLAPARIQTSRPVFDAYFEQCFLDNNLRGGFPTLIGTAEPYYLFSRKHGDMERDYNNFDIPSRCFSSGPGNFRDVNQNRRSDLYFYPFVGDYNLKLFFTLLQADGQNPLSVKPVRYALKEGAAVLGKVNGTLKEEINKISSSYAPGELYALLEKEGKEALFGEFIDESERRIEAAFGEGYWIDHWTYNVDLIESFLSVYPDRTDVIFDKVKYFYSPVYVEPRSEKYSLADGKPRQYGAIDYGKLKKDCDRRGLDLSATDFLKDASGKTVEVTLAAKIFAVILVKFSTLDPMQMGVEMECDKPGWNDAMNGLPGLFASGLGETVELKRLTTTAKALYEMYGERKVLILKEQAELLDKVKNALKCLKKGTYSQFEYWDAATSARENYRLAIKECASGEYTELSLKDAADTLGDFLAILNGGIARAKEVGGGILPSYLIYEPDEYEPTGRTNHLGYETFRVLSFRLRTLPPFLEAAARSFKTGDGSEEEYEKIKETSLYDKTLGFYKTCADIDDAPFEIGRVHAFTKGWLERECNFLHMTYKYLLGLMKGGLYERFYEEIERNFTCFMDPAVYGRSPIENSSFIVPTCNPDKRLHGRGFFARLTGANAELIEMVTLMFVGERVFTMEEGKLTFTPSPKLSGKFFDSDGRATFRLFGGTDVTLVNPARADCFGGVSMSYTFNGKPVEKIDGERALSMRRGEKNRVEILIKKV